MKKLFAVFLFVLALFPAAAKAQYALPKESAIVITGNGQGTTGAVVGTLAAKQNFTTYICGLHVDAIGGTATIGPVTLAGIVGGPMVFQGSSNATGAQGIPTMTFWPCIPATGPNTAITVTTTADGTATAVDVNTWGYQQ